MLTGSGINTAFEKKFVPLPSAQDWTTSLKQIMECPDATPGFMTLKYSTGTHVFRVRLGSQENALTAVFKRSTPQGLAGRWRAALGRTRAHRDFRFAIELLKAGIATAQPLAILTCRSPRHESWLISEYLDGAVDLDQAALVMLPRMDRNRVVFLKRYIIAEIVGLVDRFHQRGFTHRDLKASNILLSGLQQETDFVKVGIVDLEGLRRTMPGEERCKWRMIGRLSASLLGHRFVTRTDYGRFLRLLLQAGETHHGIIGFGLDSAADGDTPNSRVRSAKVGSDWIALRAEWKKRYRELRRYALRYQQRSHSRKRSKIDGYDG